MGLTLLTGGARSGKSALAVHLGATGTKPVTFVATAATDLGMEDRIARHRAERPDPWTTVEAPLDLVAAIGAVESGHTLIVDCVTLWVSNLMLAGSDDTTIEEAAVELAGACAERDGETIVVTNEVGSGVHPPTDLGIRFQDLLGRVNAIVSRRAQRAYLCVVGRAIPLLAFDESHLRPGGER